MRMVFLMEQRSLGLSYIPLSISLRLPHSFGHRAEAVLLQLFWR